MTLVISPHLDDAVLSLGQTIDAGDGWAVVTVCAGIPSAGRATEYDAARGFKSSRKAMRARRAEDEAAGLELGYYPVHLQVLDGQYRDGPPDDDEFAWMVGLIGGLAEWRTEHVLAPLGLGHPDHELTADLAIASAGAELLVYEELPYKVLWPEQVGPALDRYRSAGFTIEPYALTAGNPARKRAAIGCYRSQGFDPADPTLNVPERIWRAVR